MAHIADTAKKLIQLLGLNGARCPLCGIAQETGDPCKDCKPALAPRPGGYCPRCGKRFGMDSYEPTICSDCRDNPPPWDRLYYHAPYDGKLRDLILTYKFAAGIQHAQLFQELALAAYRDKSEIKPDIIAPVPLHRKRLLWRGFNQSLEMARLLAKKEDIQLAPNALQRIRYTRPQSTIAYDERGSNLAGAFTADADQVRGKHVLLVDDVVTSGATLKECTNALKDKGAIGVDVLVLARV